MIGGPRILRRGPARLRSWSVDLAVAVVLSTFFVAVGTHVHRASDGHALDAFGYVLLVTAGLAMAGCRRSPRLVLALVAVILACYIARRYPDNPVFATGWIALAVLSWRTDRRSGLIGAAVLLAAMTGAALAGSQPRSWFLPLVFGGWSGAAVLLGDALRSHRGHLAELEERARYLEHTREEESRRRVAEERLRIARDLHDSVGHTMATINVQASAGAHLAERRPGAARQALAAIQEASAELLDELTAMVSVLRDDGETANRSPVPGIGQIAQLVEATRGSAVDAALCLTGPIDSVPGPVGTAAYRIVQESLTNVIRHARARRAEVTVRIGDDRGVDVLIRDDGSGRPSGSAGDGTGISGMRERAEATGGRLEAGNAQDGGFAVRACWPGRR
jgi:signal transduction histidine kinase